MNILTVLRPAQRILVGSAVAAAAMSVVVSGAIHSTAAHGASLAQSPAKKEYVTAAAVVAPAKKEYVAAPAKKEYLAAAAFVAPAKKEYVLHSPAARTA